MSLMERAHLLEKLAKVASAGRGDKEEVERLRTALQKLRGVLPSLQNSLASRCALDDLSVAGGTPISFAGARDQLAKHVASRGLPTFQKINSAVTNMQQQIAEVNADTAERWGAWASSQIVALPKVKVAALAPEDRQGVEENFKFLEADARRTPSPPMIGAFCTRLRLIWDDLGGVEVDGAMLEVLEKFSGNSGLRLSEVTDGEIAVLRSSPAIADQFVIRRQA